MKTRTEIPEEFTVEYEDGVLRLEGNGKEVEKKLKHALVEFDVSDDEVVISTEAKQKDVKSIVNTYTSHLKNMIEGLENDHVYKMKAVYAHFPMTIKQEGDQVVIENFMGERAPRKIDIMDNVDVKIDGDELELRGPNKESVGQTAARIEQACKKGNRDPRTFQDGVYITEAEQ